MRANTIFEVSISHEVARRHRWLKIAIWAELAMRHARAALSAHPPEPPPPPPPEPPEPPEPLASCGVDVETQTVTFSTEGLYTITDHLAAKQEEGILNTQRMLKSHADSLSCRCIDLDAREEQVACWSRQMITWQQSLERREALAQAASYPSDYPELT